MKLKSIILVLLSLVLIMPTGTVFADHHEEPAVDTEAVELRAVLDQLFSEHAFLAITAMRKGYNEDPDYDQVVEALNGNTDDLTDAISGVYGDAAGEAFDDAWSEHIGYFVDYVVATVEEDEDARIEALDNLSEYKENFAAFLSEATDISEDSLANGLEMHVNQLIGAFNDYVDEDYESAFESQSEAMAHMYGPSKLLSQAIADQFSEEFNDTKAVTPAAELRSGLNFLLSEHFALALQAMQNGIEGSDEYEANVATLTQNTQELSATIASVYGEEGGEAFEELWSSHIGFFVDYVVATANEDEEAKEEALANLDGYRQDFSEFMSTATEGRVPAEGLANGLQTHVNQLVTAFDSYVEEDYDQVWESAREGYGHMFTPAKLFSGAIVSQFPDMFMMEKEIMFNDVPEDHWAAQYIYPLAEIGVINGVTDMTFEPDESVTRGQFVAFIARALDLETDMDNPFTDVSSTFEDEVAAAYAAGITTGVTETQFHPSMEITREQMAAMAIRAYEYWTEADYMPSEDYVYADEAHISPLFGDYVDAARELEIMEGGAGNKFNPKANATRAQAAKVVFVLSTSGE
ncbi:S-layer homology domain-containing protein [Halobacillus litoralis]|uniref:S-layer homology domain-containing protein n=1 Tax=Halobacillus litoralis TaxID=45668 RepID=UPI001CD52E7A|nr:S-layer homology domain-containing protein [Halobacillus litoralis]MCA0971121.1 S-layer homology domain-containing protein [Halobacillus litoralis]